MNNDKEFRPSDSKPIYSHNQLQIWAYKGLVHIQQGNRLKVVNPGSIMGIELYRGHANIITIEVFGEFFTGDFALAELREIISEAIEHWK